jgi:ribose 5-phosphate isomerase A
MDPKQQAGEAALEWVKDGMIVGLGTGSTAKFFIESLGAAVKSGKLKNIKGVPTSIVSEKLARASGLEVVGFDAVSQIDVTIDGADEVEPGKLNLIKGLGGALLREKLVAQNSRKLVIIADSSKLVSQLGTHSPLPVEVTIFGHEASLRFLAGLGAAAALRKKSDGSIFVTDNGNYIYDCRFAGISDPARLNATLAARAGIVESGLFIGMTHAAIIADDKGVKTITA